MNVIKIYTDLYKYKYTICILNTKTEYTRAPISATRIA